MKPNRLHIDIETFSECDLRKSGVYKYAEHPSTEILSIAWALGDQPVQLWRPDLDNLEQFIELLANNDNEPAAHNASFEITLLNSHAGKRLGIPKTQARRWICTAAKAAAHSLPRDLDGCSRALGLIAKDGEGKKSMLKLSKPRKPTKDNPATRWTPETAPEDFEKLYSYNKNDVAVERAIDNVLPDLPPSEQQLWALDYIINSRGLHVDLETVQKVQAMAEAYKETLEQRCEAVSGLRPGQRAAVMAWCEEQGYPLNGYTALDIRKHLQDPAIPSNVREVLFIRSETSRTSVKKYDAFTNATCADRRLRGMFLYHGAGTGRWSGRIVQLHNLPRGKFKNMEQVAEQIAAGDLEWLQFLYGSPMDAFSTAIRPMLTAPKGKKLVAADFSNIEGRVLAWLADETWKIQAFRDFDTIISVDAKGKPKRKGPDLYLVSAARIYGCSIEDALEHRQIGKIAELALGFGGGVGAFQNMAGTYDVTLKPVYASIVAASEDWMLDKASSAYSTYLKTKPGEPVDREEFIASDLVKQLWRASHPRTEAFWYSLDDAAKNAVKLGTVERVGKIAFAVRGKFLYMRLPSGRKLAYYGPQVLPVKTRWGTKEALTFMGEHAKTGQWVRCSAYGGLLAENAVQATARDFLVNGLWNVEAAGYPVIGHVHDEGISEVDEDFGSVDDYEHHMTQLPAWGEGCPVAAEGWESRRYRK